MHALALIAIVVVVLVVATVLFIFWLLVALLRGLTRLILGPGLKTNSAPLPPAPDDPVNTRRCDRDACRGLNPVEARFCRRCGHRMQPTRAGASQWAAML